MALTFVARKRLKASQFALNSASCLAKSPASAIHGSGVRWRNARIASSNSPRRIGRTRCVRTYTLLQKNGPRTGPGFFWRRGWDWVTRCASSPLTCSCAAALVERGSEHPYHTRPEKQKAPFGGILVFLAERVGFEPTVRITVLLISNQARSTTPAPLQQEYFKILHAPRSTSCSLQPFFQIQMSNIFRIEISTPQDDHRTEDQSAPHIRASSITVGGLPRHLSKNFLKIY